MWSTLNKQLQEQVLEAYFGATGNHYTLCRTHIASCDFSLESYTYAPTPSDYSLKNFSIDPDRLHLLPFIKAAHNWTVNPIKMFASPWSPPPWLKINGQFDGSASPFGLKPDPLSHQTYADYISAYLSAYKKEGINMWGMTIQNEPEFVPPWEGCCYRPIDMLAHLRDYLSPVMKKYHPEVKIMIYDHNKDHIADWVQAIFTDPTVRDLADGTAFHWYTGPQFENLAKAHEIAPDKFLLATEACNCPGVLIDDWSRGEHYGKDIIGDLNNWSVGWVDWNMVLNTIGGPNHLAGYCDSPIIGDAVEQTIHFQPPYFYMGHFSRFILPGYVRINAKLGDSNSPLLVTAFAGGQSNQNVVVVVMNPTDQTLDFSLNYEHKWVYYNTLPHSIITLQFH